MIELNFPSYPFRISREGDQHRIFDPVRRKFVALTLEEWVRQHVIRFLIDERSVPASLISVEGSLKVYRTPRRYDVAVFNREGKPMLVVECKAPSVKLSQETVDQVVRYNMALKAGYLMVTNGLEHFLFWMEEKDGSFRQVRTLPHFEELGSGPYPA